MSPIGAFVSLEHKGSKDMGNFEKEAAKIQKQLDEIDDQIAVLRSAIDEIVKHIGASQRRKCFEQNHNPDKNDKP